MKSVCSTPLVAIAPERSFVQGDAAEGCPVRDVLDRVGDRWNLLVIFYLEQKTWRFGELKKVIDDISARVLTQTLRNLEQDGLITRHLYPTVPLRVEYTITETGRSLAASMQPLVEWAEKNHGHILHSREKYVKPQ